MNIFRAALAKLKTANLEIFTDGSLKSGRGAWAFVIVRNGQIVQESSGMERKTTSLRMEMRAAIEALKFIPNKSIGTLHSDCRILIDALTGNPAKRQLGPNADLLSILLGLNQRHAINWKWVKAHAGIVHNERCDTLCVEAREKWH